MKYGGVGEKERESVLGILCEILARYSRSCKCILIKTSIGNMCCVLMTVFFARPSVECSYYLTHVVLIAVLRNYLILTIGRMGDTEKTGDSWNRSPWCHLKTFALVLTNKAVCPEGDALSVCCPLWTPWHRWTRA